MELWICEYSTRQDCFHVDTLDAVLSKNRRAIAQGKTPEYVPIYACDSYENAHNAAIKYRKTR